MMLTYRTEASYEDVVILKPAPRAWETVSIRYRHQAGQHSKYIVGLDVGTEQSYSVAQLEELSKLFFVRLASVISKK
jgi:hypothetical protein